MTESAPVSSMRRRPPVLAPVLKPEASVDFMTRNTMMEVARRLEEVYRSAPLGNKRNPLDELVYIQLSVRTREGAYQQTYAALRRVVGGVWERLLSVPDGEALRALAAGGMAAVKLARLRSKFEHIRERFGRVTLTPLRRMSDTAAEDFLLSLPGVGYKVARCVMLYSLDRDVFPVDSHCFRVMRRLGFVPDGLAYKQSHNALQALVPRGARGSLHINMVHHGRDVCIAGRPRCSGCVLLDLCPTGKALAGGAGDVLPTMDGAPPPVRTGTPPGML